MTSQFRDRTHVQEILSDPVLILYPALTRQNRIVQEILSDPVPGSDKAEQDRTGNLVRSCSDHVPGSDKAEQDRTCESCREIEKSEQTIFVSIFLPFCGPSLKRSFSKLRRSYELCFGGVARELGGNINNL